MAVAFRFMVTVYHPSNDEVVGYGFNTMPEALQFASVVESNKDGVVQTVTTL